MLNHVIENTRRKIDIEKYSFAPSPMQEQESNSRIEKYISGQTIFKKEKLESFVVIDSQGAGKINTR